MKINYKKINCEVCYIINETLIGDEEIKDSDDFLFCDECEKDLPFYYSLKNNSPLECQFDNLYSFCYLPII